MIPNLTPAQVTKARATVDITGYVSSHATRPSGRGYWWMARSVLVGDTVTLQEVGHRGLYSEAKRVAQTAPVPDGATWISPWTLNS